MEVDPYLVGVLRGDGWTYDRGLGSYVTCIDQAEQNKHIIIDEVVPRFRRMGLWTKPYRYFAKHDGIFKWRSLVYSKALHQELKRIFSDMTSYIKSLSVKDFLLFIAGFFDAEGTMSYKGSKRLVIYNQNRAWLVAMQHRLNDIGIVPTYTYKYNVVYGLTIIRKLCIKRFLREVPARKFRTRRYVQIRKWALSE